MAMPRTLLTVCALLCLAVASAADPGFTRYSKDGTFSSGTELANGTQVPARDCIHRIGALENACSRFQAMFFAGGRLPEDILSGAEADLAVLVASWPKPDDDCCFAAQRFIEGNCRCCGRVHTLTAPLGFSPAGLKAVNRASIASCQLTITDNATC